MAVRSGGRWPCPCRGATARPVVGPEQVEANILGREVENQAVVLLVDQEATLTVGQDFTLAHDSHLIPPGQKVDPVVRTFDKSRWFHGGLLRCLADGPSSIHVLSQYSGQDPAKLLRTESRHDHRVGGV